MKRRILVDFDGVIMERGKRQLVAEAKKSLDGFRRAGFEVIVFSTRESSESKSRQNFISDFLEKHNIVVDGITGEKLDADYYIDDKAIKFEDWKTASGEIWSKK